MRKLRNLIFGFSLGIVATATLAWAREVKIPPKMTAKANLVGGRDGHRALRLDRWEGRGHQPGCRAAGAGDEFSLSPSVAPACSSSISTRDRVGDRAACRPVDRQATVACPARCSPLNQSQPGRGGQLERQAEIAC
jgi:hypothetical protein